MRVRLKVLYDLPRKPADIDKIQRFVEYCSKCVRSFLKGFFDSEEYVNKEGYILC